MFETTRRRALQALGIGGSAAVAGCSAGAPTNEDDGGSPAAAQATAKGTDVARVALDPASVPAPIDRDEPTHHDVTLEVEEVTAEIEPGVTFDFMTFGGTVPGPMLRVRRGDTVSLTVDNLPENDMPHNVDLHAVYGTGGGSVATTASPGEQNAMRFTAMYPGAYIYHCAVPNLDYHISSGMFGMILVEPEDGLPPVDHEFYFGQHEVYTKRDTGAEGHHAFDMAAMANENPTYVLLNGEKYAYAAARHGPKEVAVGDTVRVFMVDGGPNLSSNFHPIGNVWAEAFRDGALLGPTEKNVQTMKVPPGSCMVGTMECPVPERIKLVDHALSRVARKGHLAEIDVLGEKQTDVFDPEPDGPDEGPIYGGGDGEA
jgi:nitrite reductase (NO-forming)